VPTGRVIILWPTAPVQLIMSGQPATPTSGWQFGNRRRESPTEWPTFFAGPQSTGTWAVQIFGKHLE